MLQHLQYGELFGKGKLTQSIACHNEHSNIVDQYGGTGMTIFGRLSTIAKPSKDPSGLGRALWLLLENDRRKLRVVTVRVLLVLKDALRSKYCSTLATVENGCAGA